MRVAIPALCDNLVLYARTKTFFTPIETGKCKGREVSIRKCDVAIGASTSGVDKQRNVIGVEEQEKTVYRGQKDYQ